MSNHICVRIPPSGLKLLASMMEYDQRLGKSAKAEETNEEGHTQTNSVAHVLLQDYDDYDDDDDICQLLHHYLTLERVPKTQNI